jgi:chromosome segregation ATPase
MVPDPVAPVVVAVPTDAPDEGSVDEVQTVADKILEDTQWLREQYSALNARLQVLTDSMNQSNQPNEALQSELSSLRQELRNLKTLLDSQQSNRSTSLTVESAEMVSPVDGNGEAVQSVQETLPSKRVRKI